DSLVNFRRILWITQESRHFSDESVQADSVIQIKKKMIELDLGQRELAEMTGLKQPAISRMLNMDAVPRIDTMMK
ncbi:helix-turn-helix transcriptional regulator, partial [Shigella flexneri]|nr:helix-turn-helix transcriptional regulator [Shigella flexneri]